MADDILQIVVDSNEALPQHRGYRFPGDRVLQLDCADYSGWRCIDRLRIERKSLGDLLNCVGSRRQDFERGTLWPMTSYHYRYLLLEFSLPQLAAGGWSKPKVLPTAAIGSIFSWSIRYSVQPIFAGDAAHARAAVMRIVKLVNKTVESPPAASDAARPLESPPIDTAGTAHEPADETANANDDDHPPASA